MKLVCAFRVDWSKSRQIRTSKAKTTKKVSSFACFVNLPLTPGLRLLGR